MAISESEYRSAQRRLASATWRLYDDLGLNALQLAEAAFDARHPLSDQLGRLLDAWGEVAGTRETMISAVLALDQSAIVDHGLYGAELDLKLGLWLAARLRLIEILREGSDVAFEIEEPPVDLTPPGDPLPAKKPRRGLIKRTLGRLGKALGHADNWLGSLIAALGQNERLKEIKETIERGAGDIADELDDDT